SHGVLIAWGFDHSNFRVDVIETGGCFGPRPDNQSELDDRTTPSEVESYCSGDQTKTFYYLIWWLNKGHQWRI
ncbi:hypothetical protein LINPERPRIM_LOCUS27563, partial [Linum perenne]